MTQSVSQLAALVGGKVSGDGTFPIHKVAALHAAGEGDISFIEKAPPAGQGIVSRASCLLVPEGMEAGALPGAAIEVKNPKLAFAMVAGVLHAWPRRSGIDPRAAVHDGAALAADVFVGAGASIGEGAVIGAATQIGEGARIGAQVRIGAGCFIFPNVVIYDNVAIGERCIIHAGAVIGADGFGFVRGRAGYVKFPQIGTVVIEDDVEIGANACIDRGALGETRIGAGTKLDNLVQVAHNVQVGQRIVIAAQTGISGSTILESDCVIGGQVGIGDHAHVRTGAIVGSQAGILPGKVVRAGIWWGTPVQPLADFKRMNARMKSLESLSEEVAALKAQLASLKGAL